MHSTLSTCLALRWPSVTVRMFVRKPSLLSKVSDEGNSIGSQAHHKILSGSYIQECRAMEGKLSCQGSTDAMLSAQSTLREIKREVLQADWEACTTETSRHNSTAIASRIAADTSWMKLWDMALDYGPRGTDSLQALYRELTRPQFLWCHNGCFLLSSLYSLSHASLRPRPDYQLSFVRYFRYFHVC